MKKEISFYSENVSSIFVWWIVNWFLKQNRAYINLFLEIVL